MSRTALAAAIRRYFSRRGREFCGELTTRFDFMIRTNRNESFQDKYMNATTGGRLLFTKRTRSSSAGSIPNTQTPNRLYPTLCSPSVVVDACCGGCLWRKFDWRSRKRMHARIDAAEPGAG